MTRKKDDLIVLLARLIYKLKDFFSVLTFNRRHLIVTLEGKKVKIKLKKHEEVVEEIKESINKHFDKEKDLAKAVKFSLDKARGDSNFIIFQDKNDDKKYVQFWTGGGKFDFSFPILKTNGLERYKYQVLGLLTYFGFAHKIYGPNLLDALLRKIPFYGFCIDEMEGGEEIKACFKKDSELAAKFTEVVFREFYKIGLQDISVTVE